MTALTSVRAPRRPFGLSATKPIRSPRSGLGPIAVASAAQHLDSARGSEPSTAHATVIFTRLMLVLTE